MLKRKIFYISALILMVIMNVFCMDTMGKSKIHIPQKLRIGTTISVFGGLKGLTYENLKEARSSGISDIEISLTGLVNGEHPIPNAELKEMFRQVKHDADSAGINIWSIHMPYGADCDPSHVDETIRLHSENAYRSYIDVISVLEPEVILFHPSWRLGLNERKQRMSQLVKTITSLNKDAKRIGSIIVLENLLGYKLLRSPGVERPLGRTVEEMVKIMNLMPADVYAAVDVNHIKNPERLIDALGSRIRSVHIADGDGEKECHQLPGRGKNDWVLILQALDRAGYTGPFLYEIRAKEVDGFTDLVTTYNRLYEDYVKSLQP
ncbi:sugar phosphate isomerase/epimerase family protein [Bacteroides sp.]